MFIVAQICRSWGEKPCNEGAFLFDTISHLKSPPALLVSQIAAFSVWIISWFVHWLCYSSLWESSNQTQKEKTQNGAVSFLCGCTVFNSIFILKTLIIWSVIYHTPAIAPIHRIHSRCLQDSFWVLQFIQVSLWNTLIKLSIINQISLFFALSFTHKRCYCFLEDSLL